MTHTKNIWTYVILLLRKHTKATNHRGTSCGLQHWGEMSNRFESFWWLVELQANSFIWITGVIILASHFILGVVLRYSVTVIVQVTGI